MKTTKKLTINVVALSLTTFLASSAMAGTFQYFSEYLGREATPQEVAAAVAADREIAGQTAAISSADRNELRYNSEYMGGSTSSSLEAQAKVKDRETMAEPVVFTDSNANNCRTKYYSEYDNQYRCL